MKRIYLLLFLASLLSLTGFSQHLKYSRVQIQINKSQLKEVAALGIPMEGYFNKDGFISELSAAELQLLSKNGYQYTVLIDNASEFYVKQNETFKAHPALLKSKANACYPSPYDTPAEFTLGSMGGFLTYSELLSKLDTLSAHYPQLITQKQPVDTFNTIEGQPVYWLRISNNPNVEQNKPKVLYTALTHAREPASMQQVVFYMCYLLENYNLHPDITNLINNFELYFIPCVNPDGYSYNETTDPNGGGLWRKNRRVNGGGNFGVDLNRNFGYMWGYDNQGSSTDPSVDTYRGTAAFSEPETRLVKSFCMHHNFKAAINYHTYSNFFLYPFGYHENTPTDDSLTYIKFAEILTAENKYATGLPFSLLGYLSNGDSNDWMYGDQISKPKIMSFTAEAGSPAYGFWPPMSEIESLCKDNMRQNIYLTYLSGKFALLTDLTPKIIGSHQGYFKFNFQNVGLDSLANFVVTVVPLSNNFQSVGPAKNYNNFHHLQGQNDSVAYTLNLSIASADTIKYLLVINNGTFSKSDTIVKIFGHEAIVFNDSCSNITNWTSTGWGVTTSDFSSAPASISDSPNGGYQSNDYNAITLQSSVDLSGALYAELDFNTKFDVAAGYDYVQLSISNNNGSTWSPLCGKYTNNSAIAQIKGQPSYEGTQDEWVLEQINLNDYIGDNVKFKFEIVSDWWPYSKPDGFYFDDFKVKIIDSTVISSSNEMLPLNFSVEVYPNPNSNFINITFNCASEKPTPIKVYNATGQLVFEKESHAKTEKIDVSQWPDGVYMISVSAENKSSVYKKFVKI